MPEYISGILLDFDNIFSSLYAEDNKVADDFAKEPRRWMDALSTMSAAEAEETKHRFVVRRCYMNPVGKVPGSKEFSEYRRNFVREGWEVIDTPPLTSHGKTSADIHIVMDVLDTVAMYSQVTEYVIMAADADYTPLVIRLRKHMKTTVVYASPNTSSAYRAACDSEIAQSSIIELIRQEDKSELMDEKDASTPPPLIAALTELGIKERVDRYFAESAPGFRASVSGIGRMLTDEFNGFDPHSLGEGYSSLSQMLRKLCGLHVDMDGSRTVAWKE
jgi:hypothetical protein